MLSETVQGKGYLEDLHGFTWWADAAGFTSYVGPNSSEPDVFMHVGYCNSADPSNPPCYAPATASNPERLAARSRHSRGVQAAMCDGSVQFISDEIALGVWRALSTTRGGEPIGAY